MEYTRQMMFNHVTSTIMKTRIEQIGSTFIVQEKKLKESGFIFKKFTPFWVNKASFDSLRGAERFADDFESMTPVYHPTYTV